MREFIHQNSGGTRGGIQTAVIARRRSTWGGPSQNFTLGGGRKTWGKGLKVREKGRVVKVWKTGGTFSGKETTARGKGLDHVGRKKFTGGDKIV